MEIDLAALAWEDAYRYLAAAVIPRPIAWVSSLSAAGTNNVAPYSFFNAFSARPTILGFAPMHADDRARKDTLANVVETREFVVNIATEATLRPMDATSGTFAADVDEFAVAGLTAAPSIVVAPPRVAESPIAFECRLFQLVELGRGPGSSTLVLGEAVHLHVDDRVLRDGRIDPALLAPVARLGGPTYARPQILAFERSGRS